MATCLDISGTAYPKTASADGKDHTIKPLQGKSLSPVFHGNSIERKALYWEHEGNRAVRVGDWKLVAKGSKKDRYEPVQWELFNVVKDRIEANDLIATETVRAQELKQLWQSYADRCNVFPAPKKVKKIKEKAKKKQPEKVPAAK